MRAPVDAPAGDVDAGQDMAVQVGGAGIDAGVEQRHEHAAPVQTDERRPDRVQTGGAGSRRHVDGAWTAQMCTVPFGARVARVRPSGLRASSSTPGTVGGGPGYDCPADVSQKVPQIKSHLFFVEDGKVVIVDPKENKVVDAID